MVADISFPVHLWKDLPQTHHPQLSPSSIASSWRGLVLSRIRPEIYDHAKNLAQDKYRMGSLG
jgi:hypothetical protein